MFFFFFVNKSKRILQYIFKWLYKDNSNFIEVSLTNINFFPVHTYYADNFTHSCFQPSHANWTNTWFTIKSYQVNYSSESFILADQIILYSLPPKRSEGEVNYKMGLMGAAQHTVSCSRTLQQGKFWLKCSYMTPFVSPHFNINKDKKKLSYSTAFIFVCA